MPPNRCSAAFAALSLLAVAGTAIAQDATATSGSEQEFLDNVTIIGHRRDVSDIPGSAHL